MRLSGFVLSLLFISATVLAEHGSSGGFSGGSGASWGSAGASASAFSVSSTSSGSHASSGSSAGSSHSSSASTSSHSSSVHSSSAQPSSTHSTAKRDMTPGPSLFHPFRKAKPIERADFKRPVPCFKGPCGVCPPGGSHHGVGCTAPAKACQTGQSWIGFGCVAQNGWYNDCSEIARQLADQAQRMREDNDPGQALIYERLRRQYEACLARGGNGRIGGLGTLGLFDDAELFDLP